MFWDLFICVNEILFSENSDWGNHPNSGELHPRNAAVSVICFYWPKENPWKDPQKKSSLVPPLAYVPGKNKHISSSNRVLLKLTGEL